MSRFFTGVNWQYCKNPNDINDAITNPNKDWGGLSDAHDIISITYDSNQGCYAVFWRCCVESEE